MTEDDLIEMIKTNFDARGRSRPGAKSEAG
jgi:hypothetical protein